MDRRKFLGGMLAAAPAIVRAQSAIPKAEQGAMTGDVMPSRAIVWSRASQPSRMIVTWRTAERGEPRRITGPDCLSGSDFTGRVELAGLPPGQTILYDVTFEDLNRRGMVSEPLRGIFRTPLASASKGVRFFWSGDTVGQGWGINPEWGGLRIYESMRKLKPDFFLHSGDTVYADGVLKAEVPLGDGKIWKNIVTEAKSKVAETLDEFRGQYKYNLLDENLRRFHAEVPQLWQWDDHEVLNNWSPGKDLSRNLAYTEKNIAVLAARAAKAFHEYAPVTPQSEEQQRVYRKVSYGPLLDVFVIDMRTYRAANSFNRQKEEGSETVYLGKPQIKWLQDGLKQSKAVWKVIASDMPLGLIVGDGVDEQNRKRFENSANGDGPALGRELEIASVLRFIKTNSIHNIIWLTADVHYTSANHFHPDRAKFKDFLPFWEFISGPLHAGASAPGKTDNTFGVEVKYKNAPPKSLGPYHGYQFFGEVDIDVDGRMMVTLRDIDGQGLFSTELMPVKI